MYLFAWIEKTAAAEDFIEAPRLSATAQKRQVQE
jgi:hypothetical protein